VVGATPALAALTGWSAEELRGRPWPPLWDEPTGGAALAVLAAGIGEGRSVSVSLATLRRDAEPLPTVVGVASLASGGLVACSVLALDDVELTRLTYSDATTGLANRRALERDLDAAVSRAERGGRSVAILYIDLDQFKAVNDALGHQAGDRLLSQIAQAIVGASRESDLVFRYGGDEFAVLLPGADIDAASVVADRVRSAVHAVGAAGTPWHGASLAVSASFGLAAFPEHGETAEAVLLAADRACFVAKRAGAGRITTADVGLRLAAEFSLQEPTPVDSSSVPAA
jgi:diguanylate cyclase (GGDEF)-like protein